MFSKFAVDLAERVVTTFFQAFFAALVLAPAVDLGAVKAASVGGAAAVLSLAKGIVARYLGDRDSASLAA